MSKRKIVLSFLLVVCFALVAGFILKARGSSSAIFKSADTQVSDPGAKNNAYLADTEKPVINVGREGSYSYGGAVIPILSTAEPYLEVSSWNYSGDASFTLYEADQGALIDYMVHDSDGKRTGALPDTSKLKSVADFSKNIPKDDKLRVQLPLTETGIWYLQIKVPGETRSLFIMRTGIGALYKESGGEYIFWAMNVKTKRSISTNGTVRLINLNNSPESFDTATIGNEGIAKLKVSPLADIAFVEADGDTALVPVNLRYYYGDWGNNSQSQYIDNKYFVFTDRPIYKPGDTVYFKAIIRTNNNDQYEIPKGNAKVAIYKDWDNKNKTYDASLPISASGTVSGEYKLSDELKTGSYTLSIIAGQQGNNVYSQYGGDVYFTVDYYQKPEASLEITPGSLEYVVGGEIDAKVTGTYYFGQPVSGQKVKYTVTTSNINNSWFNSTSDMSQAVNSGYFYGYYGWEAVSTGEALTGADGVAEIKIPTKKSSDPVGAQVYTIEAVIDNGTGTPIVNRKNVLVYDGEFAIYRENPGYYSYKTGEELSLPILLQSVQGGNIANISLTGTPHWSSWRWENGQGIEDKEDISAVISTTDANGKAILKMTPKKSGSYQITVEGRDGRGNVVTGGFYLWVSADNEPVFMGSYNYFAIDPDKESYQPGDTAKLKISAGDDNYDVFLDIEQKTVHQYQVVHMSGKTKTVEVKLSEAEAPSVYAMVAGFSTNDFAGSSQQLKVSAESKRIKVTLTPDLKKYGPGQDVKLKIKTENKDGLPVSSEVAVWGVDKALLEMADEQTQSIFDTFWGYNYNSAPAGNSQDIISDYSAGGMGGCFDGETKVLMADGSEKKIKDVKAGDSILTRTSEIDPTLISAKVTNAHAREVEGYLILNGTLRVTPNHFLWTDQGWREAGSISIGDFLVNADKKKVMVDSIEWQLGKFTVYNLDVEGRHTYFANDLWVHNGKGGGGPGVARTTFKDTAFWNPKVLTNSNGEADVTFTLPDNLTTWVISAVASGAGTSVGQEKTEIMVTKDVVVRPIMPTLLRIGDRLAIETVVHNFTDKDRTFKVSLQFDSGKIESAESKDIEIKAGQFIKTSWNISPDKENEKAKMTFSAVATDDAKYSDTVVQEIPVEVMGFWLKGSKAGNGVGDIDLKLFENSDPAKAKITLALSPTIFGPLAEAMGYLVDYPYGCIEQTTSRLIPVILAKAEPALYGDALAGKDLDQMFLKGQHRLQDLQRDDGGWTWAYLGNSDPFITAYVLENLVYAKSLGYAVDQEMIDNSKNFLKSENASADDNPMIKYARTVLGINKDKNAITIDDSLSPDVLALAVINNTALGNKNSKTNGLDKLLSMAQQEGDTLYWEAGNQGSFGSREASTALAIRAIIAGGGDIKTAEKGIQYLLNSRKENYWHNSFGTAQTIRAMTDYAKKTDETKPDYSFKVSIDGTELKSGIFSSVKDKEVIVEIPGDKIKNGGSKISIEQSGTGNLHWTLNSKEFIKGNGFKGENSGLSISREYINDQQPGAPIGIGDTVLVKITISGLKDNTNYGIIEDQLPSGMVPIARTYKRVNMGIGERAFMSDYDGGDREATATGMQILLSSVGEGTRAYFYRARAVVSGNFVAPPASAELMYEPSVNGKTAISKVEIGDMPTIPGFGSLMSRIANNLYLIVGIGILLILVIVGVVLLIRKKRKKKLKINSSNSIPEQS